MTPIRTFSRFLLLATLALPAIGCDGCHFTPSEPVSKAALRELVGQLLMESEGPVIIASALGAAAPPGGMSGMSALSTEIAWRESCRKLVDHDDNVASAASVVGTAAAPGGWGGLNTLVALVARVDQSERVAKSWHMPSLFELTDPNRPKDRPKPAGRAADPVR